MKLIEKYPVKFKVAKEHINYFIKYSDYKHLTQKINKSKDIKDELYRYICLPGQALTYKCGESIFMIMRDKYLQTHKNCKDFHKHILSIGPCPIQILMNTI